MRSPLTLYIYHHLTTICTVTVYLCFHGDLIATIALSSLFLFCVSVDLPVCVSIQVVKATSQSKSDNLLLFEDLEDIDLGGTLNFPSPSTGASGEYPWFMYTSYFVSRPIGCSLPLFTG